MEPMTLAVLALASYRLTRLVVEDTLVEAQRMWVLRHLAPRPKMRPGGTLVEQKAVVRRKVAEDLQCSFCVGVWITATVAAWWH